MTVALHHLLEGPSDGELVVFGGSLGSDLRMWQPQVAPLVAAGYRVLRLDHRGHGGSPVPQGPYDLAELGGDVLALLEKLAEPRVHWIGLSLGGMVGMWLGVNVPERIASLVLCCTSARLGPPEMWSRRAALVRSGGTESVAESVVDRWLTSDYARTHPDEVAWLQAMVAATPAEGYASCCAAIEKMDLVPDLPKITAPTLVIAGRQDPSTPPDGHGAVIADAIPGARLAVLDQAAHLASYEQPAKTNQLISDHLWVASRQEA